MTFSATLPNFSSDYQEGAHARVLDALVATNMEQSSGYGTDEHCERARDLIREACQAPDADVYFLVGGTQTNATVIDAILLPWQGVIAPNTGHINMHEAGIVERSGHKILDTPAVDGKICAADVERIYSAWEGDGARDHMIAPAVEASAKSQPWTRCPARARGTVSVPVAQPMSSTSSPAVAMGWPSDAPTVMSLTRGLARIMSRKRRPCRERN